MDIRDATKENLVKVSEATGIYVALFQEALNYFPNIKNSKQAKKAHSEVPLNNFNGQDAMMRKWIELSSKEIDDARTYMSLKKAWEDIPPLQEDLQKKVLKKMINECSEIDEIKEIYDFCCISFFTDMLEPVILRWILMCNTIEQINEAGFAFSFNHRTQVAKALRTYEVYSLNKDQ